MSERIFRIILGAALLLFLYVDWTNAVYIYICVLIFEGITNWRVPILVSKVRYGNDYSPEASNPEGKLPFDAERMLRLVVAVFLVSSFAIFNPPFLLFESNPVWFIPWLIGFFLFMAGITNICPMVAFLRWLGFR